MNGQKYVLETYEWDNTWWEHASDASLPRVLIVGDSLTSDMRGGNNAGILCCWYNPRHLENDKGLKLDYIIDDLNEVRGILDGTVPPVKEDVK